MKTILIVIPGLAVLSATAQLSLKRSKGMVDNVNEAIHPVMKNSGSISMSNGPYHISTIAGPGKASSGSSGYKDGNGRSALFLRPENLAVAADGNIIIMDNGNLRIRILKPGGEVITYAGSGEQGQNDGSLTEGQFYGPAGICTEKNGDILVADKNYHAIRRVSKSGISTIAGGSDFGLQEGAAKEAQFNRPVAVAVNSKGEIFVCDEGNHRIRMIKEGVVSTYAGNGNGGYADGPAADADFMYPKGLVVDDSDNLYVMENNRIRKISADGIVSTFAGSEKNQGYKEGKGEGASFNDLKGMAIDKKGNLYVIDDGGSALGPGRVSGGPAIRMISPDGTVETIAGWYQYKEKYNDGTIPELIDGPVSRAHLPYGTMRGICADAAGNIYVSDRMYNCIRKISKSNMN